MHNSSLPLKIIFTEENFNGRQFNEKSANYNNLQLIICYNSRIAKNLFK